jgi:hypothetical protein
VFHERIVKMLEACGTQMLRGGLGTQKKHRVSASEAEMDSA